ncbi:MAG: ubiquinol-cytochrome c reductase cytochrome b subunit [Ilumatobacter sp.]|uniref:cytochrome bc1 complex cytochrome b subunit n=1 Tax=Ilumatobacter sp. TaxID=1967498 RepID=UPI003C7460BD
MKLPSLSRPSLLRRAEPVDKRRGLVERYVDSVTGRTGGNSFVTKSLRKVFPSHFSFLWGELALYSFIVLLVTGTYLTLFYQGSQEVRTYTGSYEALQGQEVSAAFDSVMRISHDVKGGLLIRQMHHWSALLFMGAIALHMARVFFTGAFRRPRDLNWTIGLTLLVLSLAAGFTGYSLPDDLLSGTGLRITNGIILAIPFVGERLAYLVFGGEWPGTDIIGRLYPVHILLIPAAIVGLLTVHLGLVWHQKHTQFRGPGRTESNVVGERVWPSFAMKSIGLLFLTAGVLTAMGAIFEINPVWLYGPYDTAAATSLAQPDWYIGFLEGSVRLVPPWEIRIGGYVVNTLVFSGILIPSIIFGGLYLTPTLERRLTRDTDDHHLLDRPRDAPNRTAIGAASITFVAILFLGGAQDVVARTIDISVGHVTSVLQFGLLLAPPIAFVVTRWVCVSLRDRPGPERTERRVPIERGADGGYHIPHDQIEDWMVAGGAAPGHFDTISPRETVRSGRAETDDDDQELDAEADADADADAGERDEVVR